MKKRIQSYNDQISKFYPYEYKYGVDFNKIQTPNITFQVTDDCNLKCSYCYQINKGHHIMPLEVAQKFIDLLLENNNQTQKYIDTSSSQAISLDFIGGEPFLQVELIDKILKYFIKRCIEENHPWQYNWRMNISSNGTLYFKPEVQDFLKKWKDKLSLNITVDGNKQLHDTCRKFPDGTGSYDLAIAGVKHYTEILHGYMGSKMTLAPENIQYTCEAVKNLISLNYKEIFLNCVFEKGWENKHATILYYQLKELADYIIDNNLEDDLYISIFEKDFFEPLSKESFENWCGGNARMLALDWKGDIYPCLRYMESSLGTNIEPIIIGNVNEGFLPNKKCEQCVYELKRVNRLTQSTEECINCPIAKGCAWCQAYNYQDSGDFNHRATYICCMHKARSLANAYYWNKQFKKKNNNEKFKIWLPEEEALKIIDKNEFQLLKELEKDV